jgi:hypothetical protein
MKDDTKNPIALKADAAAADEAKDTIESPESGKNPLSAQSSADTKKDGDDEEQH